MLGFVLALALNRPGRIHGVLRAIFFASSIFSVTVVTLVWTMVLNPNQGLVANGPFRLSRYPRAAAELRRKLASKRFPAYAPEWKQ